MIFHVNLPILLKDSLSHMNQWFIYPSILKKTITIFPKQLLAISLIYMNLLSKHNYLFGYFNKTDHAQPSLLLQNKVEEIM